jgi:hypothetical protein
MVSSLGRNDPCSCGSGKKYKRCCLRVEEEARLKELGAEKALIGDPDAPDSKLRRKLMQFLDGELPEQYRTRALCAWEGKPSGYEGRFDIEPDGSADFLTFIDFLIHDFIGEDFDAPLLRLFYQRKALSLSRAELRLLECWQDNYVGLYEVQEIRHGEGYLAKDLILGQTIFIRDVTTSYRLGQWDIIAARVLDEPDGFKLAGPITLIPRRQRESVLRKVKEGWASSSTEQTRESFRYFMKAHWMELRRFIMQEATRLPALRTGTGEAALFSRAWYEVLDHRKARKALETIAAIQYAGPHQDAALKADCYDWITDEPAPRSLPSGEGLTLQTTRMTLQGEPAGLVLGGLTLFKKELELFCLSQERLDRLMAMLEARLGSSIRRKSVLSQSPEEALKQSQSGEPSGRSTHATRLPPRIEKRITSKALKEYYTRWVDMPIPALGGLTPRQASEVPEQRGRLEDLLKDFEHNERADDKAIPLSFSPSKWIRSLLRLSGPVQ